MISNVTFILAGRHTVACHGICRVSNINKDIMMRSIGNSEDGRILPVFSKKTIYDIKCNIYISWPQYSKACYKLRIKKDVMMRSIGNTEDRKIVPVFSKQ